MRQVLAANFAVINSESKLVMLMPLAYAVFGAINSFFLAFSVVLSVMIVVNALAYNERTGFERYQLTMPTSRRKIVVASYVMSLGLSLLMLAMQFVVSRLSIRAFKPLGVSDLLLIFGAACIYTSVLLPVMFKLGTEKGRMFYMACMVAAAIAIAALSSGGAAGLQPLIGLLPMLLTVLGLVAVCISCLLAIKFYEAREF